jgi:hypothetical protein
MTMDLARRKTMFALSLPRVKPSRIGPNLHGFALTMENKDTFSYLTNRLTLSLE